jgi:hypothetical protein
VSTGRSSNRSAGKGIRKTASSVDMPSSARSSEAGKRVVSKRAPVNKDASMLDSGDVEDVSVAAGPGAGAEPRTGAGGLDAVLNRAKAAAKKTRRSGGRKSNRSGKSDASVVSEAGGDDMDIQVVGSDDSDEIAFI